MPCHSRVPANRAQQPHQLPRHSRVPANRAQQPQRLPRHRRFPPIHTLSRPFHTRSCPFMPLPTHSCLFPPIHARSPPVMSVPTESRPFPPIRFSSRRFVPIRVRSHRFAPVPDDLCLSPTIHAHSRPFAPVTARSRLPHTNLNCITTTLAMPTTTMTTTTNWEGGRRAGMVDGRTGMARTTMTRWCENPHAASSILFPSPFLGGGGFSFNETAYYPHAVSLYSVFFDNMAACIPHTASSILYTPPIVWRADFHLMGQLCNPQTAPSITFSPPPRGGRFFLNEAVYIPHAASSILFPFPPQFGGDLLFTQLHT